MSKVTKSAAEKLELSVEDKLRAVYELQLIDSAIDKIKTVRGELPLEVSDLEDEIAGLETRLNNSNNELAEMESSIVEKTNTKKDALSAIKKYEEQQNKVRNNREFDSISKEIEFQKLEIELADKKTKEFKYQIELKTELVNDTKIKFEERSKDLEVKRKELNEIVSETQKEEEDLMKKSAVSQTKIDARLLSAYKRIRRNVRNGFAVVTISRNSCGGCFNSIPPQTQMDIAMHKKILVCEYCGRILIENETLAKN